MGRVGDHSFTTTDRMHHTTLGEITCEMTCEMTCETNTPFPAVTHTNNPDFVGTWKGFNFNFTLTTDENIPSPKNNKLKEFG